MLCRPTSLAVVLSAFAQGCGLETSGLFSDTPRGSLGGPPDAGVVSPGAEAGGATMPNGSLGQAAANDASLRDSLVGVPFVDSSAGDGQSDASVPAPGNDGASLIGQDGAATDLNVPDTGSGTFACGPHLLCVLANQVCCVGSSNRGSGPATGSTCEIGAACIDPSAVVLLCTAAANCPAPQVCCLTQQSGLPASQCTAQCSGGDVQLCDLSAPSNGCTGGASCMASQGRASGQLPTGVGICN